MPDSEVIDVELSVEDAFKLVMSAGLVTPDDLVDGAPVQAIGTATHPAGAEAPLSRFPRSDP